MKRSKTIRIIIACLLIGFTLLAQPLSAYAVTQEDIDKQQGALEDLNKDIKTKQNQLSDVRKQQKQTIADIQDIEADLEAKEAELIQIETNLENTQADLVETKADLEDAIERCNQQQTEMADRVRAVYIQYESAYASYLNILFSAENLGDFLAKLNMVRSMLDHDNGTLDTLQAHQAEVADLKARLEQKEADIKELKAQAEEQKTAIEQKKAEREQALSNLKDQESNYEDELDHLEKESKEIEKLIQQLILEMEEGKYAGGVMTWPVPGFYRITSGFGYRIHPISGVRKMHTGIDIGSNWDKNQSVYGQNFVAAASGKVILSQYYGGYGNCVIISHGSGISTLYAHGSACLVSVGDTVKRGQAVLRVGSTGASTGAHAHFEVRENGVPVDPMKYLKD
jgi:murein DD-endopeptidase MepM/ murein hydrolase activator NlpD